MLRMKVFGAALVLAVACVASVFVQALPSGNVVHSWAEGYWQLDSLSGFSQIADSYTTGWEDMWTGGGPSASSVFWNPDEEEGIINMEENKGVVGNSGVARKLKSKLKKVTAAATATTSSSWTISAWVYIASTSTDFALFTFGPKNLCDGENGLGFFTWTGPMLMSMSSCNLDGTQGTTVLVNGWHHVAVSYGIGNTPVTTAYLDGVVEFTSTVVLQFNPEIAFIGARTADTSSNSPLQNGGGNFYLDDLRIWSRALTQAEVQFDKHGGAVKTGLIGNYDGSVTTAGKLRDLAKSNHATRQGVAATFTTTAVCPLATYIASCGLLACRYVKDNSSIPMCGPCLAGYHSTVLTNLSANCALDVPNPPTSPLVVAAGSNCLSVSVSPPLVSAAITSYSIKYGTRGTIVAASSPSTFTTVCGLTNGKTYTFSIRAINAAGTGAAVTASGVPAASGTTGCKVGHYMASGATACTACAAGSYANVTTATSCTTCAIGSYARSAGSSTCSSCPIGHYGHTTGLSYCHSCARGRYGDASGITVCAHCAAGSFSAVLAQTVCGTCVPGTYQPFTGRSVCLTCAKSSASSAGASTCV